MMMCFWMVALLLPALILSTEKNVHIENDIQRHSETQIKTTPEEIKENVDKSSGSEIKITPIVNNRTGLITAAVVTGVQLLNLTTKEISFINEKVLQYKILVFKQQGVLTEEQIKEVGLYFGPSINYRHPNFKDAKLKEISVFSNDAAHGLTGVGSKGWHIDGYFFDIPHSHVVYHMVNVTKKGPTMFVPLSDIVAALPDETRALWDRIWIICDTSHGKTSHPFIYPHPVTGQKTISVHFKYIQKIVFDLGSPKQRTATPTERHSLAKAFADEFDKDNGYWHYLHYWEQGDVVVSDNRAVAHQAHPDATKPASQIGLRVLKRACVQGTHQPMKSYPDQQPDVLHRTEL